MDEVIANCIGPWTDDLHTRFGVRISPEKIRIWDFYKDYNLTLEQFLAPIQEPGYFFHLDPIPGAVECLSEMHKEGHEIIVVTSPPNGAPTSAYDKQRWVAKHFPFIPRKNVVFAPRKDIVSGDILIDDAPHNIKDFPGTTILWDAPYNRRTRDSSYRVKTWREALSIVRKIAGEKNADKDGV
jgi:5'(3')-deoxyribonucleotidase